MTPIETNTHPNVLIVDDRSENQITACALLEDLDVQLICASSGEEALALLLEHSFAVVLLDVQMPGMDGFETLKMMRQHPRTRHTPVVFVTALSTERRFMVQGYDTGAIDYMVKPLDPHVLRSKVQIFVNLFLLAKELDEKNAALERMAAQLHEAAIKDQLTGLYNRRFVHDLVSPETAIARRLHENRKKSKLREAINTDVGFLMIDIDHFKLVNDNHGHDAGDKVLKNFAKRVAESLRESDSLVRWGGEEFLVLLRRTEPDGVAIVAERIRASVEATCFNISSSVFLTITCSIGFSRYPVKGDNNYSWEEVLTAADKALYLAKTRGRNQWIGVEFLKTFAEPALRSAISDDLELAVESGAIRLVQASG